MSSVLVSSDSLTTQTNKIAKTRYFSVELQCVGMIPLTTYDVNVDSVLMNAFMKPYGKNLGDPCTSDAGGRLLVQYHMSIPYNQSFLVTSQDSNGYMAKTKQIVFVDPNGVQSVTYLPIRTKASS